MITIRIRTANLAWSLHEKTVGRKLGQREN